MILLNIHGFHRGTCVCRIKWWSLWRGKYLKSDISFKPGVSHRRNNEWLPSWISPGSSGRLLSEYILSLSAYRLYRPHILRYTYLFFVVWHVGHSGSTSLPSRVPILFGQLHPRPNVEKASCWMECWVSGKWFCWTWDSFTHKHCWWKSCTTWDV